MALSLNRIDVRSDDVARGSAGGNVDARICCEEMILGMSSLMSVRTMLARVAEGRLKNPSTREY
jgi:hypothetical protein